MEIRDAERFVAYWRNIRGRTRRVIDCIPEDRFDWTHTENAWTFADLTRHLAAAERWMFAENVQGRESRYPGCGPELADGAAAVRAYMDERHAESVEIFAALSDEQLVSKCGTPGGIQITVWKWLRAMVEHEVHHRGQIYLMLGVLGIDAPPLYGLTEEQVFERSSQ
ncbi:MAG: DinB family protein [Gemmatimonadetes bacterium]|nr:DinB family protein [Gemmatimonadota bacterium]